MDHKEKELLRELDAKYRERLEKEISLRKEYEEKYRILHEIVAKEKDPFQKKQLISEETISTEPYTFHMADVVKMGTREFLFHKLRWVWETFWLRCRPLRFWKPVFDPGFYGKKYPELAKTLNYDRRKLLRHFIEHGMYEGRQGKKGFDPERCFRLYREKFENAGYDLRTVYLEYIRNYRKHEQSIDVSVPVGYRK